MGQPAALEILRATEEDVPAIVALWHELAEHHSVLDAGFALTPDADTHWRKHLEERMAKPDEAVYVAFVHGVPAGFIMVRPVPQVPVFVQRRVAQITDLGVAAPMRRRGIATALWKRARSWCRAKRYQSVDLDVVIVNDPAAAFWQRMGFRPRISRMRRHLTP